MRVLVIGGSGLIGSAVVAELLAHAHDVLAPSHAELDLADPPAHLPQVDAAVICAGPKGFRPCEAEGAIPSWRVNVDGVLNVALRLMGFPISTKVVFVSSDAVEWSDGAYARQKAVVEVALQAAGCSPIIASPTIIRPERVTPETAPSLAVAISIAIDAPGGVIHWP
jgi:uncharacterized protein YbjT (DUF2867 family)